MFISLVFAYLYIFMRMSILSICVSICLYTACLPGAPGSQKRAHSLLELELEVVLSHHGILGTEPGSPGRAVSCLSGPGKCIS